MHLGVVLARLSKHVDDTSARRHLMTRPILNYCGHLHSRAGLEFLLAVAVLAKFVYMMNGEHVVAKRLEVAGLVFRLSHRLAADLVSAVALSV